MTNTLLKIIAFTTMVISHIGIFIPNTPIWLHWFGMISAPIFIFCIVEAYVHTTNKTKLFMRLYILSVIMQIISQFLYRLFAFDYFYISRFWQPYIRTLLGVCILIWLIENFTKKFKIAICIILFNVALYAVNLIFAIQGTEPPFLSFFVVFVASASMLGGEFGLPFLLLGLLFYFTRNKKSLLAISYSLFSLLYFLSLQFQVIPRLLSIYDHHFGHHPIGDLFYNVLVDFSIQILDIWPFWPNMPLTVTYMNLTWLMIFSLIFILLYNGKLGRHSLKIKYAFYIAYPLHVILLFYIGNLIYNS